MMVKGNLMELKEQDILFGPLEVGEIKDLTHLHKSYSSYKSAFRNIAYNTAHCVSFAGTRLKASSVRKAKVMAQNVITDAYQFVCGASKVYYAAVGIMLAMMKTYPGEKIFVFGHSLGGGLMQFACSSVNSTDVAGYGYNSAGLSWYNMRLIAQKLGGNNLKSNIGHICAQHDPISFWGHQIGDVKYIESSNALTAHCLEGLNKRLNGGKVLKVWF